MEVFCMEKLKKAMFDFDELETRIDGIVSLSFLMWDTIVSRSSQIEKDTHGGAAFLLNHEIETIRDELQDIKERMFECLKEMI